jgi:hypothetical protein
MPKPRQSLQQLAESGNIAEFLLPFTSPVGNAKQFSSLHGRQPVAESNTEALGTFHSPDTRCEVRTQQFRCQTCSFRFAAIQRRIADLAELCEYN